MRPRTNVGPGWSVGEGYDDHAIRMFDQILVELVLGIAYQSRPGVYLTTDLHL